MLNEAYGLFSEAFAILQQVLTDFIFSVNLFIFWCFSLLYVPCLYVMHLQVTGPMHREVANCCRYVAY